jgi:hypothetical protein
MLHVVLMMTRGEGRIKARVRKAHSVTTLHFFRYDDFTRVCVGVNKIFFLGDVYMIHLLILFLICMWVGGLMLGAFLFVELLRSEV